ncbi:MAG: CRTAC1 family protein [Planctomycetota bacterium]|nr:CRTAC1 family protein [Planctomycetota bacterium]
MVRRSGTRFGSRLLGLTGLLAALLVGGCYPSSPPTPHTTTVPASEPGGPPSSGTASSRESAQRATPELESKIRFTDKAQAANIHFAYHNGSEAGEYTILESLGGGVALVDYDGDGRLDLFFPGGGRFDPQKSILPLPSLLLRNLGDWQFEVVSDQARVRESTVYSHGVAAGDYDNDGFPDLLVTGYGGLQLFHNQGDGTFREVGRPASVANDSWNTSAGWADLDGDGNLDLYVTCYVNWSFANHPFCPGAVAGQRDVCSPKRFDPLPDFVYLNNGDGTFRDASVECGLRRDGKGLGVVLGDIDLDGDVDIYVANDTTENFLYINDGHGHFEEAGLLRGVALDESGRPNGSMGVDLGDYDLDGWPDLFVANYENESFGLYRNLGQGNFQPVSRAAGVTSVGDLFVGFGAGFIDVDRDGAEDLIVANGHVVHFSRNSSLRQLPLLLLNDGAGRFIRARLQPDPYFSQPHSGRGMAVGDLDDDGNLDIAISHNNEPVAILRNETVNGNHWLRARLVGRRSNRDAVGARLVLQTSVGNRLRLVKGGGSYLSQSELRVCWGIPAGATAESLSVTWPAGGVQTVKIEHLDHTLVLIEP